MRAGVDVNGDRSLADRYEALRVSRSASLERRLFIGRGMVAWMEAWSSVSELSGVEPGRERCGHRVEGEATGQEPGLAVAVHGEVADILAGMTWAVLRS